MGPPGGPRARADPVYNGPRDAPAPTDDLELELTRLHPGVTLEQAREAIGWELTVSPGLAHTDPPTAEERAVLRRFTATLSSGGAGGDRS